MPAPVSRTPRSRAPLSAAELARRARAALIWSTVFTLALWLIPYGEIVGYPLLLLSTLVHELGHGVAGVIVGGQFDRFVMHADGSGQALIYIERGTSGAAQGFISAGGLCGPAVAAAFMLVMARRPARSRFTLAGFGLALVLAEILVVRNGFGIGFVALLAAACLAIAFLASDGFNQLALVFLSVQLALSVWSRGDYLFTESAGELGPSDVKNMETALALPYWFWGGLCALFSVAVLVVGGWHFLRAPRPPSTPRRPPRTVLRSG
jgi:hypothetical protein